MSEEFVKRDGERLEHPVMVSYRTVDRFLSDFGTNISRGGIFVNTAEPLPVGTEVTLLVSLPDMDAVEVHGRVTRTVAPGQGEDPGMGIMFLDASEELRGRLDEMVSDLQRRLGAE